MHGLILFFILTPYSVVCRTTLPAPYRLGGCALQSQGAVFVEYPTPEQNARNTIFEKHSAIAAENTAT